MSSFLSPLSKVSDPNPSYPYPSQLSQIGYMTTIHPLIWQKKPQRQHLVQLCISGVSVSASPTLLLGTWLVVSDYVSVTLNCIPILLSCSFAALHCSYDTVPCQHITMKSFHWYALCNCASQVDFRWSQVHLRWTLGGARCISGGLLVEFPAQVCDSRSVTLCHLPPSCSLISEPQLLLPLLSQDCVSSFNSK